MDSFLKAFIKYLLIIERERVKDKKKKSTKNSPKCKLYSYRYIPIYNTIYYKNPSYYHS